MMGFAAGIEMADMAWEVKCREEDMKQRALENERHAIDDARRAVDEKAQQLKVLANQSALIAGFSMVAFVEINIPQDTSGILLTLFGGAAALVIALMLISTLNATYMLVAILRYDCVAREVPFDEFWMKRCEPDWKMALRTFSYGIPLFMMVVALVAWIVLWDHDCLYYTASIVTVISVTLAVFWFASTQRKWGDFLMMSQARITNRSFSLVPIHVNSLPDDLSSGPMRQMTNGSESSEKSSVESNTSLEASSLAVGTLTKSEEKLKTKPFAGK
ncbi:hypothetical protein HJC23_009698 [Cyclotella cryptica]|uniref:Uncharacterized protein n=1 Tax=Cyclotella cryptica TaxID=29204 RepID=A0ABD3Q8Y8_9STRA